MPLMISDHQGSSPGACLLLPKHGSSRGIPLTLAAGSPITTRFPVYSPAVRSRLPCEFLSSMVNAASVYYHGSYRVPLTMEELIADIPAPLLDVEEMLLQQKGAKEVPFNGMDKSGRGVCMKHVEGVCSMGNFCPLRHLVGEKAVVCKHWLRGLCKKGDMCEFLHEYDLSKMPECFFFSKYQACSNRECPFRHIDPESKIRDCPWYERGFCRHGPFCKHRHRRRVLCPFFLAGFCKDGSNCKFAHPTFNLPAQENSAMNNRRLFNQQIVCHNCHERGHKATHCPHLPTQQQHMKTVDRAPSTPSVDVGSLFPDKKALSEVTCYKCGEKGHYANRCTKGVLAFLSNTAHLAHEQRERDEKEGRGSGRLP